MLCLFSFSYHKRDLKYCVVFYRIMAAKSTTKRKRSQSRCFLTHFRNFLCCNVSFTWIFCLFWSIICWTADGQCPNPTGVTPQLRSLRTHWLHWHGCLCSWTVQVCNAMTDKYCYVCAAVDLFSTGLVSIGRKFMRLKHISLAHLQPELKYTIWDRYGPLPSVFVYV